MTVIGEAFIAISPEGAGFAKKLESQLKAAGLSNAGLVVGAGVAGGIIVGLAAIGAQFDKTRKQIESETGATGVTLDRLAQTVTRSFRAVPVSLGDAAAAVDELTRRGVPLGRVLDTLSQQELFLAKITKSDLAQTVEDTTGLMQKFNVPLADQSRELDVLFKAYQQSGQSLSTLTAGLQTGGAILQQFGFSLDQSAALVAGLEKASVNLQPALAGLRLAFGKIATSGGDPKKVLADLLAEFRDGASPTQALSDAIKLFGKRSGAELAVAIQKGKFSVDGLLKSITDGKGGIIETGLATLTFTDQLKLLRNNIEADLSGLSTTVLHDFESGLQSIGPPLEALIASGGELVQSFAPALSELRLLVVPLAVIVPLVTNFAAGVHDVASVMGVLPGPVVAAAAAVGVLVFAIHSYNEASLLAVRASVAFDAAVEFATGPIGLAIGAVTLLGFAFSRFRGQADPAKKISKDLGDSLFDAGNQSGIFAAGIATATQGLQSFITQESQSGKLGKDLVAALGGAGQSAGSLGAAIAGGTSKFAPFVAALLNTAAITKQASSEFGVPVKFEILKQVGAQLRAFQLASRAELDNVVITGQATKAQVAHIEKIHASQIAAGDYTGALDDLNRVLGRNVDAHNASVVAAQSTQSAEADLAKQIAAGTLSDAAAQQALQDLGITGDAVATELDKLKAKAVELNQVQDAGVTKTLGASGAYRDLARQIANGTIVEADAETKLQGMGFSADGAKTAFGNLQSQIQSFVSTAVGALPSAGGAVDKFTSDIQSAQSTLESDLQQQQSLQDQLQSQLEAGQQRTGDSITKINNKIAQDQANIANGSATTTKSLKSDLDKRALIMQNAATTGGQASAQLARDIAKNNAAIVADYKKLAEDNDPTTFAKNLIANAVQIAEFQANLQTLVTEGFGGLAGVLAEKGPEAAAALAKGLADNKGKAAIASAAVGLSDTVTTGFTQFVEKNFPELANVGAGMAGETNKGFAKDLDMKTPLQSQIHDMGAIAAAGGPLVAQSFLSGINLVPGIDHAIHQGSQRFTQLTPNQLREAQDGGRLLGVQFGTGVAVGLDSTDPLVGLAADRAALAVKTHFQSVLGIKSPSTVGIDLGHNFGAAFASGLASSAPGIVEAGALIASQVVTSVQTGFGRGGGRVPLGEILTQFAPVHGARLGLELGSATGSGWSKGVIDGITSKTPTLGQALHAFELVFRNIDLQLAGDYAQLVSLAGQPVPTALAQQIKDLIAQRKLLATIGVQLTKDLQATKIHQPHPQLISADLAVPTFTPQSRLDVSAFEKALHPATAQPGVVVQGPLVGQVNQTEHADPIALAGDLGWYLRTLGVG